MLIQELAAQNVKGFSPSARVSLKPGYIGVKGPTEIPPPLCGLFLSVCYPDGRGGDAAFLTSGAKNGRVGFSLQADDGTTWRLVRDLGGAGKLNRFNPQTQAYELVTEEAAEMIQVLRTSVGLPARPTFESLFVFTAAQLPTRRPKQQKLAPGEKGSTGKNPALRRMPSALDAFSSTGSNPDVVKASIARLEEELKVSKVVADLQFKLDGVQSEIFQTQEKARALAAARAAYEEAKAELESAPTPQSLGLPDDIVERVRRSNEEKKRYEDAMRKLMNEREEALESEGPVRVPPIYLDRAFLGSLAGGVALLFLGALMEDSLRLIALLSIPAFSFAALVALRFIERLQFASRESAKTEVFAIREKKLRDEFGGVFQLIERAFEKTQVITADEFYVVMARRQTHEPKVQQLEAAFAELQNDPQSGDWEANVERLKREHEAIDQQLLEMSGGYIREQREIQAELDALKEQLAPKAPVVEPKPAAATTTTPAPNERFDDPMPALMSVGMELFGTDIPTLWAVMRERCVQYLAALSDRRYASVDVDKDGNTTLTAGDKTLNAGELPGRDLDLVYLSVRFTLIEKYCAQAKVPVLIEDLFGAVVDAPKIPLIGRMLKHLGGLTQVIHVTGVGHALAAADHVLTV